MKTLKQQIQDGQIVFGGTVAEHLRPSVVKAFANAGFDFIYLEKEHASFEPSRLADFVLCARDNGLTVVSKIPHLERGETAWLLEMGVMGIQLPRTESRQELETLHDYIKFPPIGSRASATGYGNTMYGKPASKVEWYEQANAETMAIAHIETQQGVEQIDDILSADGVDICFVGCSDLSLSYANPGNYRDSEFLSRVQKIIDVALAKQIIPGLPAIDDDMTKYWIDHGVKFFECVSELDLIRSGSAKAMKQLHQLRG